MWDLLLKGATVVDPLNRIEAVRDVAIENGQIAEVGVDLPGGNARVVEDYTGKVLQPGIVDSHVHCLRQLQTAKPTIDKKHRFSHKNTLVTV